MGHQGFKRVPYHGSWNIPVFPDKCYRQGRSVLGPLSSQLNSGLSSVDYPGIISSYVCTLFYQFIENCIDTPPGNVRIVPCPIPSHLAGLSNAPARIPLRKSGTASNIASILYFNDAALKQSYKFVKRLLHSMSVKLSLVASKIALRIMMIA
jgi:hypothetical protein